MADFDPIDINFVINKDEVKRDAEQVKRDIRGVAVEAEAVTAKANQQTAGLIYGDDAAKKEAQRIVDLQRHYAELQKKIQENSRNRNNRITPDVEEAKASANAIDDVADKVEKLGAETVVTATKQKKAGESTGSLLGKFVSLSAAIDIGLELLKAYGPEILNYIKNMFGLAKATEASALAQETLNKAFDSSEYKKGIANIIELRNTLELAKDGFVDQTAAIDQYNEIIGDTAGKAQNLTDVEQGLIDNADAYIEMTFKKAAANLALEEAAEKAVEAEKRRANLELTDLSLAEQVGLGGNVPGSPGSLLAKIIGSPIDIAEAQKRADAAADVLDKEGQTLTDIYEKLIGEAETAAKKLKTSVFGNGGKDAKKVFDQRKKLLEQIASLDREYNRKQLTTNAAEVQAIKDKFEKVRKLVREFNADPKNSKARISIDALDEIEGRANADLLYKQDTRALKVEIAEQKKIYEEYEQYKAAFGNDAARQKYAEQLKDFETFTEKLKSLREENKEAFAAFNSGDATANQTERVGVIATPLNKETADKAKAYQEQLANLLSYNQERALAIEQFEALKKQLIADGKDAAVAVAEEEHQEVLDRLDDANIKKTAAYKELFDATARITKETGEQLIANAKKLLETQNLSADVRAKILRVIAETEAELANLKADQVYDYADALGNLGAALSSFGASTDSTTLSNIGRGLTGLAQGANDLMTTLDDEATDGQKIGAATNSFVNLVGIIINSASQRKQAEADYYNAVLGFQNDYNLALQDQVRLQTELSENAFITDYQGRIEDGLEAVKSATVGYQDAIKALDEATVKSGTRNTVDGGAVLQGVGAGAAIGALVGPIGAAVGAVVGGIIGLFAGKKKKDQFVDLLSEYPKLLERTEEGVLQVNRRMAENLVSNNLVNDKTKEILNNIIEWDDKLKEAREQIRGVVKDLAGNLGDDIRNDLVEAFKAGEDAAIAMGDTIEGVLENVVSQLLFNQVFGSAFDKLEDDFAKSFEPLGGDGTISDELAEFFDDAKDLTKVFNQGLEDAQNEAGNFGFDIFDPEQGSGQDERGLAGAVRRELTEETGSELTGLYRNTLDTIKSLFEQAQKNYALDQKNSDYTFRIMQTNAMIEENTRNTAVYVLRAVSRLDDISKNTKKDQSSRDLGL